MYQQPSVTFMTTLIIRLKEEGKQTGGNYKILVVFRLFYPTDLFTDSCFFSVFFLRSASASFMSILMIKPKRKANQAVVIRHRS